jgi:hypothetical protein
MTSDCTQAKRRILTQIDRWAEGRHHHPMSKRLLTFLKEHDLADHNGYFDWKSGGDGDNGEILMFQMDAFFEFLDAKALDNDNES